MSAPDLPSAPDPTGRPDVPAGRGSHSWLGLQRRGITVLIGAAIIGLLGFGVMVGPVPYVVLVPGPTVDTLGERDGQPVILIGGGETGADPDGADPDGQGQLHLTTVGVQPEVGLLDAIRAWFSDDRAVVPEELFFPPGQTREEVEERNTEQFTRSQSAAETAAMRHLGYPVRVAVAEVVEGGPADGVLRPDDMIIAVEGDEVATAEDLARLVTAHPVGATVEVEYIRDGVTGSAKLTTTADPDEPETPRIGVLATVLVDHPYDLTITVEEIGGPSAGLMFALGIIDKLDPDDLTGGSVIAGTGTIDADGAVGAIGGIPQKLVAARAAGASAFLVPAGNCPEAAANQHPDLRLVRGETLAGALDALATLRTGGDPPGCE
jgi:Lon-like protease